MGWNGLNANCLPGLSAVITKRDNMVQTDSQELLELQKQFEKYLGEKDFLKILDLEKKCQIHDAELLHLDNEKSLMHLVSLKRLTESFKEGMDEENVRKRYVPIMEAYKAQGTRPRDASFEIGIRSLCRYIGSCIGARSSLVEKSFYETRQKCLLALKQEHQRNLDRAMGYEKKKSPSKGKKQEISR